MSLECCYVLLQTDDSSKVSQRHQRHGRRDAAQQQFRRRRARGRCSVHCCTPTGHAQEVQSPRVHHTGVIRDDGPARDDRASLHLANVPMPRRLIVPRLPGGGCFRLLLLGVISTTRFLAFYVVGRGAARAVGSGHERVVREVVQRIGHGIWYSTRDIG